MEAALSSCGLNMIYLFSSDLSLAHQATQQNLFIHAQNLELGAMHAHSNIEWLELDTPCVTQSQDQVSKKLSIIWQW